MGPHDLSPRSSGSHSERHRIRRIAKACEPCRTRKTKCDIVEQFPCGECVKRSMHEQCVQRVQARRRRKTTPDPHAPARPQKKRVSHVEDDMEPARPPPFPRPDHPSSHDSLGSGASFDRASFPPYSQAPHESAAPSSSTSAHQRSHTPFSAHMAPLAPDYSARHLSQPEPIIQPPAKRLKRDTKKAVDRVEGILYSLLQVHCPDLTVDFGLPPERLIDLDVRSLSLADIGVQPGQPDALARAQQWVGLHFTAIHHNTPFLHRPTVEAIARRYFNSAADTGDEVEPDERALLFSVLALGSFREKTYDPEGGKYQPVVPLSVASPAGRPLDPNTYSASVLLFELAQSDLTGLDTPTELAVQALFLLHTYVCNTSLGRWSRDFVARAVMMSHEVGLNRRMPPALDGKKRQPADVAMRRSILYLYVLFADVYLAALDSHPPLIKKSDYDPTVFDPILYPSTTHGSATPPTSPTAGLSAFVDLVRTGGEVLESWRGPQHAQLDPGGVMHLLEVEEKLEGLRNRLGDKTFSIRFDDKGEIAIQGRAVLAGRLLRQIHYNWIRIALREPYLETPLLAHSSLAVCSRAAVSVLAQYRHVMSAGLLNLPWMQLRRIATSIELVFIAHMKGELLAQETEEAIRNSLVLFSVLGTRWQSSNRLAESVRQTADALGLRYTQRKSRKTSHENLSASGDNHLDAVLSALPDQAAAATTASDPSAPSSVEQQGLSDPFWDSLNAMWGQGAPSAVDMMDGFGSWMASNGFGESPDLTMPTQVAGPGSGPLSWDYAPHLPAGGADMGVAPYANMYAPHS